MYGSYEITAEFYDEINSTVDYGAWADFIEGVFARFCARRPELLLDLGCGTGVLTLLLAERGYDMTGVDSSPEMLAAAHENAERAGVDNVLWLCQDMSAFELYGTVDAVVSTCDSLNYLTRKESLRACLSLVHNYLVPDGLFVFDISSRGRYRHIYGERDFVIDGGDVYCGWQNSYNDKSGLAEFYLSYFVREGDMWRRLDEVQRQRCRTVRSMKNELVRAGFEPIGVFRDTNMTPLGQGDEDSGEYERIYFAARVKKTEKSGNNGL